MCDAQRRSGKILHISNHHVSVCQINLHEVKIFSFVFVLRVMCYLLCYFSILFWFERVA